MALGAALTWQWAFVGEAPAAVTEAGATSPAAPGLGLVYQPPALFPTMPAAPLSSPPAEGAVVEPISPPLPTTAPALPAPTVTMVAAVQYEGGTTLTPDDIRAVLRLVEAPDAWIESLTAIALCESHGRTGAIGDGGNSLGPWQLWFGWAAPMGYQPDDLHDPTKAARTAVYIRTVRGRFGGGGGWTCADLLGIP